MDTIPPNLSQEIEISFMEWIEVDQLIQHALEVVSGSVEGLLKYVVPPSGYC